MTIVELIITCQWIISFHMRVFTRKQQVKAVLSTNLRKYSAIFKLIFMLN